MMVQYICRHLTSSREARRILISLDAIASRDGFVTVDDFFNMCSRTSYSCVPLPENYGWTREMLIGSHFIKTHRGIIFVLEKPIFIEDAFYCPIRQNKTPSYSECASSINRIGTNGPATVVFFADGTKTVVKRKETDQDDLETAIGMAVLKHLGLLNMVRKEAKKVEKERKELEDSERTGD